jgi:serine protease
VSLPTLCRFMLVSATALALESSALAAEPTDAFYGPYQWSLRPFPVRPGGPYVGLDLPGAWDITRGTAYIGIVDNGIDPGHPELGPLTAPYAGFTSFRPQFASNASVPGAGVDERPAGTDPSASFIAGHGMHVFGIISARSNDPTDTRSGLSQSSEGVAGVCWRCGGIVAKFVRGQPTSSKEAGLALKNALLAGAQVANVSLGTSPGRRADSTDICTFGPDGDYEELCKALAMAKSFDVPVVASVGNENWFVKTATRWQVDFPASDPRVIAVGAVGPGGERWSERLVWNELPGLGSNQGADFADHGVVAPGRDVISTFYRGGDWNSVARCRDIESPLESVAGYGPCTGTSMAAPHVTGIIGLMRSVDPMTRADTVRKVLFDTASDAACGPGLSRLDLTDVRGQPAASITQPNDTRCRSYDRGYGVPSARKAVESIRDTANPVLLTPLFAFRSNAGRYFYTVVPQMGRAAVNDTLLPKAAGLRSYMPVGVAVRDHTQSHQPHYTFPGSDPLVTAKAQVWVYSTHRPPGSSQQLVPLMRISRVANGVVDHVYGAGFDAKLQSLIATQGYQFDGIEGYISPANEARPYGAVELYRASKDVNGRQDFALFPESERGTMQANGYVAGLMVLGYVFQNFDGIRPIPQAPPPPEMLPLAPVGLTTTWAQCYGRNHVSWTRASDNVRWWDAQKKLIGTTTWVHAYTGAADMFTIDVTNTTDLRVRACNELGCTGYAEAWPAFYYPQCPVPY